MDENSCVKLVIILLHSLDINECLVPNICGLGACTNNDDGTFYQCDCQDGAVVTGMNSDNSLTCIGTLLVRTTLDNLSSFK